MVLSRSGAERHSFLKFLMNIILLGHNDNTSKDKQGKSAIRSNNNPLTTSQDKSQNDHQLYILQNEDDRIKRLKNPQKIKKKQEKISTIEINTLNQPSFTRKVISQMLPPKHQKPSPQKSSYQLYKQEQKQNKLYKRQKAIDWKQSHWPSQSEKRNVRDYASFIRSRSYSQQRNHQYSSSKTTRDILHTNRMQIQNHQTLSPKQRSVFIRTKDGKRKQINNRKYLERIKHNLEVQYFSAVKNFGGRLGKPLKPEVTSLSPKFKEEKPSQRKVTPRAKFEKSKFKSYKQTLKMNFNEYNTCRPWSGNKGELANVSDLPTYFPSN